MASEKTITIPSSSVPADISRELLARARAAGLLIAPLISGGVAYGALVMATSRAGMSSEWLTFAATVAAQLAQTVALSKTIEDLKVSDQSLREKQERFRQLAENVSEVFFVMDSQYRETLYINPAYEKVWGRTCQSLYDDPMSFSESVVPEDRDALFQNIAQTQRGEAPDALDFRITRPDGTVRWISANSVPVRDAQGNVYRISGVARDITERREIRLALEESVARYQRLTEASFDAIGIVQDGRIVEVNPGFVRTFGYEHPDEIVGRPVAEFATAKSRDAVTQGVANDVEGTAELECLRKDGKTFIAEVTSRMHVMNGRPARITALRDITQQRTLEAQFRQAQKMEAVGRLAGGVAHDFNNLLTVVSGHTAMLLEELMPGDPRRGDLEQIERAAVAAAALTRQLLTFSRRQVIEPRILDLADVVSRTKKMLRHLIGEDIEITTSFSEMPCVVQADAGQLEQVIMNLAVNARDAMPRGGKLEMKTGVAELGERSAVAQMRGTPGRFATLAVTDTGIGMDPETKDRIFEPFFTTKEQGKGTGLGLATVHGIVEQSGGFIDVDSRPGAGTTFTVYLPLVDGTTGVTGEPKPESNAPLGTETVLLVEDSAQVRDIARRALERQGYVVMDSDSAIDALVIAKRPGLRIHALLTDVVMPQMSGRELAERFAELHPSAKVIYMSGYTDDAVVRHGVLGVGTPYLQKPFTLNALACKVREVLDAR